MRRDRRIKKLRRKLAAERLGQGTGHSDCSNSYVGSDMNADTIHTALGLVFTLVWLFVGQILVGSRA